MVRFSWPRPATHPSGGADRNRVRVHTDGITPEHSFDRTWSAENSLVPWLGESVQLDGARILEYGAGDGQVSRAFAKRAASVHGIDIDAGMIQHGRRQLEQLGVENVRLEAHPVEEIVDALRAEAGKVDIVLLYAVVEHLSIAERIEVLTAAREVAMPHGVVAVIEAPNRLCSFDSHSIQLPYFNWLPQELKELYVDRATRPEVRSMLPEARAKGPEAEKEWWIRFGTGVSYHEFELVFGDLQRHIVAGGYDTVMWPTRPLHPEELPLARDMARQVPHLGPMWSRQWLDFVLTPEPLDTPPPLVRPWTMETVHSEGVASTAGSDLLVTGPQARVGVRTDTPTRRVILGYVCEPGPCTITVDAGGSRVAEVYTEVDVVHRMRYVDVSWDTPSQEVDLRFSRPGYLQMVACET